MNLLLQKKLEEHSERVKCVELHEKEPWVLAGLYNGHLYVYNYDSSKLLKTFEVCEQPIRCCKFVTTRQWILSGSDDFYIRAFNYNTSAKVVEIEAHSDYIRYDLNCYDCDQMQRVSVLFTLCKTSCLCPLHPILFLVHNFLSYNFLFSQRVLDFNLAPCNEYLTCTRRYIEVHPSLPFFLSSADDMTIKLWDFEHNNFENTQMFEGHVHYVMMCTFNPKDSNCFASASLDKTIKVWSIGATDPNFTLEGHEGGVNCVSYYPGGDRPLIVSGSDDKTVRIWDYQTKACLQKLVGHDANVSCVMFHPKIPVLVSGSEDSSIRMWDNSTYRCEGMRRG